MTLSCPLIGVLLICLAHIVADINPSDGLLTPTHIITSTTVPCAAQNDRESATAIAVMSGGWDTHIS